MIRIYLNILGVITILVGLAWYPAGLVEYAGISMRVRENYSTLIERGIAKDDPDVTGTLMNGLLRQMERQHIYIAGFLVVLGGSILAASARIGKLQNNLLRVKESKDLSTSSASSSDTDKVV